MLYNAKSFIVLVLLQIWYDYDLKLVRFDTRAPLFTVQKDFSLSNGPFRTIHDYGLGRHNIVICFVR